MAADGSGGSGGNGSSRRRDRIAALGLASLLASHGWPVRVPTDKMSPLDIWESSDAELVRLLRLPTAKRAWLLDRRRRFDAAAAFRKMAQSGIHMVALGETAYPQCLAQIHDPPPALFHSGDPSKLVEFLSHPRVAIVGARRATRYGLDVARSIAEDLARQGVCVVSGMALGIDAAAHQGALRATGSAIAILGCGVDIVYPRANMGLYRQILESGLIASEYPPGTEPRPWRFPARNRIMAGLSEGVIVVEAGGKSGALITADFALEQGKEVWAVPGEIFSDLSSGPHRLIRLGATTATSAADVLEDLGIAPDNQADGGGTGARTVPEGLSGDERRVHAVLAVPAAHQDVIATKAGLDGSRAAAALISLELRGLARRDRSGGYSL